MSMKASEKVPHQVRRQRRAAKKAAQTKIRRGSLLNPTFKQRMMTESKSDYYPAH
jgi:hypothetical protein